MDMNELRKKDFFLHQMLRDQEYKSKTLIEKMRYLANDLIRASDMLEKEGRIYNSLGIIQSQGNEIDRLMGEVNLLNEMIEGYKISKEEGDGE